MPPPKYPPAALPTPGLVLLLSVAAGASVANSYYNQAMLGHLAREFGLSAGMATLVPVLTQGGNAVGVLLLAPLGDRLERRRLILATIAVLVVALVAAALAPGFVWLAAASFAIGLFATVAQQIVPLAVHLAPASERGKVLGVVTGGILTGILLSRTLSGVLSDMAGWRAVFWFAASSMIAIGVVLAVRLPRVAPTTDLSYPRLLGSLWTLLRIHRPLRKAIAIQFLIFAAFIAFWSNLSFLLAEPRHGHGATAVGLLALVGVAGAFAAPVAGGLADRCGHGAVVLAGGGLVFFAFLVFGLWPGSLPALVIGILLLDLGVQSSQVANQMRVYALDPTARSRLNTVFMATMLAGGALGAGLGGAAYAAFGWSGTCAFGVVAAGLALVLARRS